MIALFVKLLFLKAYISVFQQCQLNLPLKLLFSVEIAKIFKELNSILKISKGKKGV